MSVLMGLSLGVAYALGTGEWKQVARRATTKDLALESRSRGRQQAPGSETPGPTAAGSDVLIVDEEPRRPAVLRLPQARM